MVGIMKKCFLLLVFLQWVSSASDSYYYTGVIKKFEACKGPKRKNCSVLVVNAPNEYTMNFDLLVKENVALTVGKVTATRNNQVDNKIGFQMKKPCDHYYIRQTLKIYLKITDDCVVLKNHYVFSVNIRDGYRMYSMMSEYTLGDFTYHTLMYGDRCNVVCTIINLHTERVNNTKRLH